MIKNLLCGLFFLVLMALPGCGEVDIDGLDPAESTRGERHQGNHGCSDGVAEWERFNRRGDWTVEWNETTGTPHKISGHYLRVARIHSPEMAERVSGSFLHRFRCLLQIEPDELVLTGVEHQQPGRGDGTWLIYYHQEHDGVPVQGSVVRFTVQGQHLTMMGSDFVSGIAVDTAPVVSEQQMTQTIGDALGQQNVAPETVELVVITPMRDEVSAPDLVWKVTLPLMRIDTANAFADPTSDMPIDRDVPVKWRAFGSATTGEILWMQNLAIPEDLSGTSTGMVYPEMPSDLQVSVPIEGITVELRQTQIDYTAETDDLGFYSFSGLNADPADLSAYLQGPEVVVYNDETLDAATHTALGLAPGIHDWDWALDDPSPNQVETNAYYHVNLVRQWFNQGDPYDIVPDGPDAMSTHVEATVRDDEYCNAFALIGIGKLHFGRGNASCEDLALCADIIYHEYGHLAIQQVYDDAGIDFDAYPHEDAMHEALADYFGTTLTGNPALAGGCKTARNIDTPNLRFPENYGSAYHQNGRILAGALWDVRAVLGAEYTDSLAIRALRQTPVSFHEFLGALLEEDDNPVYSADPTANNTLTDGSPNIDTICAQFTDVHGIYHSFCAGSTADPVAILSNPSAIDPVVYDDLTTLVQVTGTAQGSSSGDLSSYVLEYAAETDLDTWHTAGITLVDGGLNPVDDDVLGDWDFSGLGDGYYILRLTVTDDAALTSSSTAALILDRQQLPGWPKKTNLFFPTAPIVVDLDPATPGLEVMLKERWGWIYAYHQDGTNVSGWPKPGPGWPFSPPTVADLDGDGFYEVVLFDAEVGEVDVLNHDGTARAGWPQTCPGTFARDMVAVAADLDHDGLLEIQIGTEEGEVYAWHTDGTPVVGWPVDLGSPIYDPLAVGNVDSNVEAEVVVGTADGRIHVVDSNGLTLSGWPQDIGETYTAPVLGDLDSDGELEIVATSASQLYVWDHDGVLLSGWPQAGNGTLALGDLDEDGQLDVVSYDSYRLSAWSASGALLAGFPLDYCVYGCSSDNRSPALGDLDGDGDQELVALQNTYMLGRDAVEFAALGSRRIQKLIAVQADGTLVDDMPRYLHDRFSASPPTIADVDQDGDAELVMGGEGMFVWDLDGAYSGDNDWPEFRHDSARTGAYPLEVDCAGVWHGDAYYDNCGDCATPATDCRTVFVSETGAAGALGSKVAPVRSIQEGVDLAASLAYLEVHVASGSYTPSNGGLDAVGDAGVTIADPIIIRGGWDSGFDLQSGVTTVLDGESAVDHVIWVDDTDDVELEYLEVTGGFSDGPIYGEYGGGIGVYRTYGVTFSNLWVHDNYSVRNGAGMYFYDSGATSITDVVITSNTADSLGGGINLQYVANVSIDADITDNSGYYGAGIYMLGARQTTVTGLIQNNIATGAPGAGSGIMIWAGEDVTVTDATITDNSGYSVIHLSANPGDNIDNLVLHNNTIGGDGGGYALMESNSEINGQTFTDNTFLSSTLLGAYWEDDGTILWPNFVDLNTAGHIYHDATTASGNIDSP